MLSTALVLEIRRLVDEGKLSRRQIAKKLQVSRATVAAIAGGRRGLHGRDPATVYTTMHLRQQLAVRCPHCGGLVFLPCRLCAARAFRTRRELLCSLVRRRELPHRRTA